MGVGVGVLTYPPTYLPTHLLTYLPTYLPTYPPTHLPTHLLTYLPTYLLTHLLTYLPTYLPTYPPTFLLTSRHLCAHWRGGRLHTVHRHERFGRPFHRLDYLCLVSLHVCLPTLTSHPHPHLSPLTPHPSPLTPHPQPSPSSGGSLLRYDQPLPSDDPRHIHIYIYTYIYIYIYMYIPASAIR